MSVVVYFRERALLISLSCPQRDSQEHWHSRFGGLYRGRPFSSTLKYLRLLGHTGTLLHAQRLYTLSRSYSNPNATLHQEKPSGITKRKSKGNKKNDVSASLPFAMLSVATANDASGLNSKEAEPPVPGPDTKQLVTETELAGTPASPTSESGSSPHVSPISGYYSDEEDYDMRASEQLVQYRFGIFNMNLCPYPNLTGVPFYNYVISTLVMSALPYVNPFVAENRQRYDRYFSKFAIWARDTYEGFSEQEPEWSECR
ncbi:hypothetical protein F4678DRAFT_345430 [Xylaria arbuscula]|nr:hypothetical protein F4678DRAFT_345430 [Xylaria arbuscula]